LNDINNNNNNNNNNNKNLIRGESMQRDGLKLNLETNFNDNDHLKVYDPNKHQISNQDGEIIDQNEHFTDQDDSFTNQLNVNLKFNSFFG
jgi:hypothetical protein